MAITREFLAAHGITDEAVVSDIMRENDAMVSAHGSALAALQQRYDTDTADLRGQLETQAYDHAAEKFLDGYKFSSQAARRAAMADFKAKGIKYADGKFEGAEAFMDELKTADPGAFIAEGQAGSGGGGDPGAGTGNNGNGAGTNGNGTGANGSGAGVGGEGQAKPYFAPTGSTGSGSGSGQTNPFADLFGFQNIN